MWLAKMVFMASMFKWRDSYLKETNFVFLRVQFVIYLSKKLIEEVWLVTWGFKRLRRYFKVIFIGHGC